MGFGLRLGFRCRLGEIGLERRLGFRCFLKARDGYGGLFGWLHLKSSDRGSRVFDDR